MNQWAQKLVLGVIMEAMTILSINDAGAEPVFGLGAWRGALELGSEWEHQTTHTGTAPDDEFKMRRYDERVDIRNEGFYIVDPRLFTGSLGLTFDLFQENNNSNGEPSTQNGTLTGYAFDGGLFAEKPLSGRLFANRNQDVINRQFGGRSDMTFESQGGEIRLREDSKLRDWGVPYFDSTLSARREHTLESTEMTGEVFNRDETRNIVSLQSNKGFETSNLGFFYEFVDDQDRLQPQTAFQTHTANLNYSLDFGPTLNRRWDSRLHFYEITNGSPQTFYSADERVRIDHNKDLYTDYHYLFTRVDTVQDSTTTHYGTILAEQRLYRNLTTTYMAQGKHETFNDGQLDSYAGQLDFNYQRAFTPERRVFARLGGRYQINDNDLQTSQINVVDEPHVAPALLGGSAGFTLNNPFVNTSTIVVVDIRGGSRLSTTLGVDYDILQEGDYTKIIPLPTSPVILPGDPLVVSYSYAVAPSIRYSTESWWVNGGIDFHWIAFSLSREVFDQTLLGGLDDQFLEDRQTDRARLELRGDWEPVWAQATATYESQNSTHLIYTRRQFGQFLSYRPGNNLTLGLDAEESDTVYTLPIRESKTRFVRFTADRYASNGWQLNAFAGWRTLEDSDFPSETIHEAGLKARRTYGKLDVVSTLTTSDRKRGSVESTDDRFEVRLIRRFF